MDAYELSEALSLQTSLYSDAQLNLLESNFLILPFGEPKHFNDKEVIAQIMAFVGDNHLDGIFIDSLSSTTPGDLASEKETKFIFELDARVRSTFTCFTFYVHHNRKAQADNKRPNKLADLHGSVHIQSKPNTVLTLWPLDQKGDRIAFKPLKLRSHKLTDDIIISRNDNLHYVINNTPGSIPTSKLTVTTKEEVIVIGDSSQDIHSDGNDSSGSPDVNLGFD